MSYLDKSQPLDPQTAIHLIYHHLNMWLTDDKHDIDELTLKHINHLVETCKQTMLVPEQSSEAEETNLAPESHRFSALTMVPTDMDKYLENHPNRTEILLSIESERDINTCTYKIEQYGSLRGNLKDQTVSFRYVGLFPPRESQDAKLKHYRTLRTLRANLLYEAIQAVQANILEYARLKRMVIFLVKGCSINYIRALLKDNPNLTKLMAVLAECGLTIRVLPDKL